jgi:hypothetical protein
MTSVYDGSGFTRLKCPHEVWSLKSSDHGAFTHDKEVFYLLASCVARALMRALPREPRKTRVFTNASHDAMTRFGILSKSEKSGDRCLLFTHW